MTPNGEVEVHMSAAEISVVVGSESAEEQGSEWDDRDAMNDCGM